MNSRRIPVSAGRKERIVSENGFSADEESSLELPASMFHTGDNPEVIPLSTWRPSQDTVETRPAQFTEIDGLAVFEGDIVLGSAENVRHGISDDGRGVGITGEEFRWPRGEIPYVADATVRERVNAAIAHWQQKTPFRFRARKSSDRDSIAFKAGPPTVFQSRVGRQGGEQIVTLGSGCTVGSTIHEIGHAVGLWHEQSREDRNTFVTIVSANIVPEAIHNFDRHVLDGDDLGGYDYGSIMHYPRKAFSKNGQDTIVPTKVGAVIGQRDGLSKGDIASLRKMYPRLHWPAGDEAETPAEEAATPA